MDQRLTRSHTDRMLTGVAGGMAEYFDIDPVIIRLLWVLGALFTGGVLLVVYFVMAIIMPSPPDEADAYEDEYDDELADDEADGQAEDESDGQTADESQDQAEAEVEPKPDGATATAAATASTSSPDARPATPGQRRRAGSRRTRRRRAAARRRGQGAFFIGSALIVIGALALVDQFSLLSFWQLWPLILIGIGGALILGRIRRRS